MEIHCSDSYDEFKRLIGNRPLVEAHVKKIVASMKKRGFIKSCPVVVNQMMQVADGQHRVEAARRLGLPVWYVVDDNLTILDVIENVSTVQKWTALDYVRAEVERGNPNYSRLVSLADQFSLSVSTVCQVVKHGTDSQATRQKLIHGQLTVSQEEIESARTVLAHAQEFEVSLRSFWRNANFIRAINYLCHHELYKKTQMRERLAYQQTKVVRCATVKQFVQMLQDIYNHHSRFENKVDFVTGHNWKSDYN